MYSRQLEDLARRRARELRGATRRKAATTTARSQRPLRSQTGWALVWIGLRIAESGSR
ncbi:MAG TPA: hypothetical protein VF983_07490 [Streptosporangiaceae bacterium]